MGSALAARLSELGVGRLGVGLWPARAEGRKPNAESRSTVRSALRSPNAMSGVLNKPRTSPEASMKPSLRGSGLVRAVRLRPRQRAALARRARAAAAAASHRRPGPAGGRCRRRGLEGRPARSRVARHLRHRGVADRGGQPAAPDARGRFAAAHLHPDAAAPRLPVPGTARRRADGPASRARRLDEPLTPSAVARPLGDPEISAALAALGPVGRADRGAGRGVGRAAAAARAARASGRAIHHRHQHA